MSDNSEDEKKESSVVALWKYLTQIINPIFEKTAWMPEDSFGKKVVKSLGRVAGILVSIALSPAVLFAFLLALIIAL